MQLRHGYNLGFGTSAFCIRAKQGCPYGQVAFSKGAFNNYVDQILTNFDPLPKLYIPSTLNIALLQWHTHLNVCAVK